MLANHLGYYSLIFGLFFSVIIIPVSIKDLNDSTVLDKKIFSISFFNKLDINLLGYIENNTSNQVFNSADESLIIKNQTCIGKIIYSEDIYNLNIKKSMNLVSDISRTIQSLV